MMLWMGRTQYASNFGKLSSGHRTGKSQFSFQSQRKAMLKNVQTTAQLHSSHILVNKCSKFSNPGSSSTCTVNFQMFKLDLENAEEPEIKLSTSVGSSKKGAFQKKILLHWTRESLWLCGSQQTVENSERDGNTRPLYLSPEKPVCTSRTNRIRHGTNDWFNTVKGV